MKKILNIFWIMFFLVNLNAQAFVNQTKLTINQGALVHIDGKFLNAQNGSIKLEGEMTISGNLNNTSSTDCFLPSTGKVNLTGNSDQYIKGSHAWSFPILNLKNGSKYLNQTISVGTPINSNIHVLMLNSANLILNANPLVIKNAQTIAISRTTGFIVNEPDVNGNYGKIHWNIGNSPKGSNFVFPFGNLNSGHYTPMQIALLKDSKGVTGTLIASTYPTPTSAVPNNRPLPVGVLHMNDSIGNDVSHKSVDRFWTIESSKFDSLPLIQVTMNYRDLEWDASNNSSNVIVEDSLVAQQYENNSWNKKTNTLNINSNSFIVNGISSLYQVWRLTDYRVLPTRGLSRKTKADDLVNDQNGMELVINPISSGEDVFSLNDNLQNMEIQVYPNPSSGLIHLKLSSASIKTSLVKLLDLSGKIIDQWTISENQTESFRNLSEVATGTYVLILINENEIRKQKLVITR